MISLPTQSFVATKCERSCQYFWHGMAFILSHCVVAHALSTSASTTASYRAPSTAKIYEARLFNDLRHETLESRRNALLTSAAPSLDNDAWIAALFDDVDDADSEKARAEDYDRLMADDVEVSSVIKDNLKPGSLVNEVTQAKGADVDAESILQMKAVKRRAAINSVSQIEIGSPSKASSTPLGSSKHRNSKNPLLTREHEYELARAIQLGVHVYKVKEEYESNRSTAISKRDWASIANVGGPNELRKIISEYRCAKQELVSSNMGLVHAVARDFQKKAFYRGLTLDELVQEGSLGLVRAAELFDPKKGLRFSTYATIWIKGTLSNLRLDEFVKLPYFEKKTWNNIRGVIRELEAETGLAGVFSDSEDSTLKASKKITTEAIALKLGLEPSHVAANIKRMNSVGKVLSLDYQYTSSSRSGEKEGVKSSETLLSNKCGDDANLAERAQLKADIVSALVGNLNEQEIHLIRLMYGLHDGHEYTIKESAAMMGLNRETARLLHHACLKKLREASNMESLQEYLLTIA